MALTQARMGNNFGQVPQMFGAVDELRGDAGRSDYTVLGRQDQRAVGRVGTTGGGFNPRGRADVAPGTSMTETPYRAYRQMSDRTPMGGPEGEFSHFNNKFTPSPRGAGGRTSRQPVYNVTPGNRDMPMQSMNVRQSLTPGSPARFGANALSAQQNYQQGAGYPQGYVDPSSPGGDLANFQNRFRRQNAGFGRY